MKIFYACLVMLFTFEAFAQPITNMPAGNGTASITSCNRIVRDHGGTNNYGNNQNSRLTVCSGSASQFMNVNFSFFSTASASDFLEIYAGPTATGLPIQTLSGNPVLPFNLFVQSNCVTFRFVTDGNIVSSGFIANVTCYSAPTCSDGIMNGTEQGVDCGGCFGCPPCPTTTVPPTVTANASVINLPCGGGPVDLSAVGNSTTPVLSSNFNLGTPGAGWNFTGPAMWNNPCGPSPSGTTHLWFGNASPEPRVLRSIGMDLSCGGTICFDLRMAIQAGSGSCEGPDLPNEGVTLSYSTDCGATFQNIAYFHPNGTIIGANPLTTTPGINGNTNFTTWANYCFPIPAAAQSPNTIIQWSQILTSGAVYDHWGLDEIIINANNCNPFIYDWAHVPGSPNPANNTVNVATTTTFNVVYTNGIGASAAASVTVNVAGPVNTTISTTPVNYCVGTNSGSATFTGNGTTNPPYTFNVVGPAGFTATLSGNPTATLNNLPVGNYTVTTTDGTTCSVSSPFVITAGPYCCDVSISPTNLSCNIIDATCNGSTQALPVNGLAPYTYQWYQGVGTGTPLAGQTNQIMSNLCAGTYTVQIADQSGCTDVATVTLTQPTPLTLSGTHTNVTCFGLSNGTISVTAGGGTAGYTYVMGTVTNTTGAFTNLSQGSYLITITDAAGCSIDTTIVVTAPPLLGFNINTIADAYCGFNNGIISLSATGGTGPFTYDIGGGNTNNNGLFNTLAPSTYVVLITDANGCNVSTYQIIINGQPNPILSLDSVHNETCFGNNAGYISVSTIGNYPGNAYTYSLNGGPSSNQNVFSNLAPGVYTIQVTDPLGCQDDTTITITSPPLLTVSVIHTDANCNNECDGTITPTISGGTGPYTYSLNGGVVFNNPPLNNLCAGTYFYVVKDSNDCLANQAVTISEPTPITMVGTSTPGTCGLSNGVFTVNTITGGSGSGYSISFNGSPFSGSLIYPGLAAGFYWLVVQDGAGCLDSNIVLINNLTAPFLVNLIITDNLCFGETNGTIEAQTTGGIPPPYTFAINGGPGVVGNSNGGYDNIFIDLGNDTYVTSVTDANGCISLDTLTVTSPPPLSMLETHQDLNCFGDNSGYINLIASGGVGSFSYSIGGGFPFNNTGFFGGLPAGTYFPTAQDANGCTVTLPSITLTQPPLLTVNATPTNPLCNATCNGTISFVGSGGTPGYTYSINGGTNTFANPNFTNVCAGTYNYQIQDSKGCIATGSTTLIDPAPLTISTTAINSTCNFSSGIINVTSTGGTPILNYNLNGAAYQLAPSFGGLTAGTYLVTVQDGNGCTAQTTQLVTEAGSPSISSIALTHVSCNGGNNGAATVNVSGGTTPYSYSLNGAPSQASPNFLGLTAGNYTMIVTDDNGCTANAAFTITQPTALSINLPTVINVPCFGASTGSITLNPTGGTQPYQYSFNGGVTFSNVNNISSITAGTYNIQVMDANGCSQSINLTLSQPPALAMTPVITNASCSGVCDGSIALGVTGGTPNYSYNWSFNVAPINSDNAVGLCAGSYNVIVTDNNGCVLNSGNISITEPGLVQINSAIGDSVTCNGYSDGTITVNATNTVSYTINGPSGVQANATGVFTNLLPGYYDVIAYNAAGCSATTNVFIYEPAPMVVTTSPDLISCPNQVVTHSSYVTGGTPPYAYAWSNTDITSSTIVNAINAQSFTVNVTDAKLCPTVSATVNHNITPIVQINPIAPIYLCNGESTVITATAFDGQADPTTGYVFSWSHLSPTLDTETATVTANANPASYWVVVKDLCLDLDSTEVLVYPYQAPALTLTGPVDGCSPQIETFTINSPTPLSNCTWDFGNTTTGTGCGTITSTYTTPGVYTVDFDYEAYTGCPFDTTFTNVLEIFQNPVITSIVLDDPLCDNAANGIITVNGSLGQTPYDYQLNALPTQVSNTFNGLASGNYTTTIIDQNGCSADSIVSLIDPPALTITSVTHTNVSCFNGTNGSITITAAGGTPGYTYSYDGGLTYGSNAINSTLAAGNYHVYVQDANGCLVDSANIIITQPNQLVIDLVAVNNASCYNVCDGDIFVGYTGGTAPITYIWSPNAATGNSSIALNLCDGTYDILLLDALGCSADSNGINVTEPAQIVVTSLVVDSVTCFGAGNGQIAITATNAVNYQLTGPMPTVNNATGLFTNLIPGAYTITMSDVNACTIDTVVNVYQPAILSMTNSGDTVVCYDVPVVHTVNASGGTLPYTITWNTGATGSSLNYTALQDTILAVTIVDANGCTLPTQNINVTVIPLLAINPIANQTLCIGDSISTVATAQFGQTPYTFHWTHLPTGNNSNPVFLNGTNNPSVYTVIVSDLCGNFDSTQVSIFNYTAPTFNLTGPVDGCSPQNENFSIVGASSPISNCAWDFGNGFTAVGCGPQTSTYTLPGTYSVQFSYEAFAGCQFDTTFTNVLEIFENPVVDSILIENPSCFGLSDGQLTVYASLGTPTYSYQLGAGAIQLGNTFTGMAAGLYSYTVSDINNCVASDFVTLVNPPVLTITNTTVTNALCFGSSDGAITVTATGGTAPYQYSTDGITYTSGNVLGGLSAGTYTVYVRDTNSCVASVTNVIVGQPTQLVVDLVSITDASCFDLCDGSIFVGYLGGIAPITYTWSANANTGNQAIANNVCAGTYSINLTDNNGCSVDSIGIVVNEPPQIIVTSIVTDSISCFGGNDGVVTIYAINAVTYEITNPFTLSQASNVFNGLLVGTYTVELADVNGCTIDTTFQIAQPSPLQITSVVITPNLCNGDNTGGITVAATGGTAPYQYAFDGGAFGPNNSNLALLAGSHSVAVQDANGCQVDSLGIIITQPTPVLIDSLIISNALCFGASNGTITVGATGGTAPYQYSMNGVTFTANNVFNNLAAGNYTVYAQDSNLCIVDSTNVIVGQPNALVINSVVATAASCFGVCDGSIVIGYTGGTNPINYAWSANANTGNLATASNLCAGSYSVTLTDSNGCIVDSIGILINQPPQIVITAIVTDSVNCFAGTDGIATITALNAVNYAITSPIAVSQASNVFNGLAVGTYQLQLTDAQGCTLDSSFQIMQPTGLTFDSITTVTNLCNGDNTGGISVFANGGSGAYQYSFDGSPYGASNTISGLAAGPHNVSVQDANGCILDSIGVVIAQPTALTIDSLVITDVNCFNQCNGSIVAYISGGNAPYDYTWSANAATGNTNTAASLCAGAYNLQITDDNGCTLDTIAIPVTQPAQVIFIAITTDSVNCFGGSDGEINVTATNALSYSIDGGVTTQPTGAFTGLTAGFYTITIQGVNGCSATSDTTVFEPTLFTISSSNDTTVCDNSNITLVGTGQGGTLPYTLQWTGLPTGGTQNVVVPATTTYTFNGTDANGCPAGPETTVVTVFDALTASPLANATVCPGGTSVVNANVLTGVPVFNYVWSPAPVAGQGTPTATLGVGAYNLQITDNCGAVLNQAVTISEFAEPQFAFTGITSGCAPHTITVDANNGTISNCQWNFGTGAPVNGCGPITFTYNNPGIYNINFTYTSVNGCPFDTLISNAVTVSSTPEASFTFSPVEPSLTNNTVTFTNTSSGGSTYSWTFGADGSSSAQNPVYTFPTSNPEDYNICLTVSDVYPTYVCSSSICELIPLDEEFSIYVPNAFTPDNNEHNNEFRAIVLGEKAESFNMQIFNRWGELVFESRDHLIGWDGTYGGQPCQDGVYIWKVTLKTKNVDDVKTYTGHVTIIR